MLNMKVKEHNGTSMGLFILFVVLSSPISFVAGGFVLMLLMGDVHHWAHQIPSMGFWQAGFIYWLLLFANIGLSELKAEK